MANDIKSPFGAQIIRFPTERRMSKSDAPTLVKRIIQQNQDIQPASNNMIRALRALGGKFQILSFI